MNVPKPNCLQSCAMCEHRAWPKKVPMWTGSRYFKFEHGTKIMFVGEAPGRAEYAAGLPFVGPSGKLLDAALDRCGLTREDVAITNALKCPSAVSSVSETGDLNWRNVKPDRSMIENCRKWLEDDIQFAMPDIIIALGHSAFKATPAQYKEHKPRFVMRIHHPAYILRKGGINGKAFGPWVETMRKAVRG